MNVGSRSNGEKVPESVVVPRVEEELAISKDESVTGTVSIHKNVHEKQVNVSDLVSAEDIELERMVMNVPVEEARPPWNEGSALIVSVYEERLVTRKQLFLKETLRITKRVVTTAHPKTLGLKEEEISLHRSEPER
jgi:uncharacterized protein (TIGR02271 family)